jgi:hypothetical protein
LTFRDRHDDKAWSIGTQQYNSEHWIGSHPTIVPYDLSKRPDYWYWRDAPSSDDEFEFSAFPREEDDHVRVGSDKEILTDNTNRRIRSYRYFAGHVHRWLARCGAAPPLDSWVSRVYPDGQFWKIAVKIYGLNVFDEILMNQTTITGDFVSELITSAVGLSQ